MTLDLKIAGRTSDLGFQVWTAVRLGISSLNSCQTSDARAHESKIQDFEKLVLENLGSNNPIWILDFCPGSKKSFLIILDLGSWVRIQGKFFDHLGCIATKHR